MATKVVKGKKMHKNRESSYYELALREADVTTTDGDIVLSLLDQAAAEGDERAIYARASCYDDGKYGSKVDHAVSNAMFMSLKQSLLPEALFAIAYCYDVGDGVKRNTGTAFLYYLKAAILGSSEANSQVSEFYREGRVVKRSTLMERFFRERSELDEAEISPRHRLWLRPKG